MGESSDGRERRPGRQSDYGAGSLRSGQMTERADYGTGRTVRAGQDQSVMRRATAGRILEACLAGAAVARREARKVPSPSTTRLSQGRE